MKLSEVQVPDEFRAKYVLSKEKLRAQKAGLFIIPKKDHQGRGLPRGPLKVKSAHPEVDAVKLKADNGDEFIVRRTEVSTVASNEIVREWLIEQLKQWVKGIMYTTNITEAARMCEMPEVAIWSKLQKARKHCLDVPQWFK